MPLTGEHQTLGNTQTGLAQAIPTRSKPRKFKFPHAMKMRSSTKRFPAGNGFNSLSNSEKWPQNQGVRINNRCPVWGMALSVLRLHRMGGQLAQMILQ